MIADNHRCSRSSSPCKNYGAQRFYRFCLHFRNRSHQTNNFNNQTSHWQRRNNAAYQSKQQIKQGSKEMTKSLGPLKSFMVHLHEWLSVAFQLACTSHSLRHHHYHKSAVAFHWFSNMRAHNAATSA